VSVHAELANMIERVRSVDGLARKAAPRVARVVEAELRRTTAAHATPSGERWPLRQDGGLPLERAMASIGVGAVGTTIYVRLTGPTARHHKGTAAGKIRRQVIPDTRVIPAPMAAEIRRVLDEVWSEAFPS
jgi:hypothetical protein